MCQQRGSHQILQSLACRTALLAFGTLTGYLLVPCCLQELQALEKHKHHKTTVITLNIKVYLFNLE